MAEVRICIRDDIITVHRSAFSLSKQLGKGSGFWGLEYWICLQRKMRIVILIQIRQFVNKYGTEPCGSCHTDDTDSVSVRTCSSRSLVNGWNSFYRKTNAKMIWNPHSVPSLPLPVPQKSENIDLTWMWGSFTAPLPQAGERPASVPGTLPECEVATQLLSLRLVRGRHLCLVHYLNVR
jgi:hypothetical protein